MLNMIERKVIVEGSGRHCHVTRDTLDILYGKGFELVPKKWLSQPGQYASEQRVTVVGPKGQAVLTIIGPCRKYNQVELSLTDARSLGFDSPVRESGHISETPGCKLIGPKGETDIDHGVIIAKRHLHLTPADAEKFGIKDQQIVKIKVGGERALIFDEVVARVGPDHATAVHLDYDEFNAASLLGDVVGEILI